MSNDKNNAEALWKLIKWPMLWKDSDGKLYFVSDYPDGKWYWVYSTDGENFWPIQGKGFKDYIQAYTALLIFAKNQSMTQQEP